MIISPKVVKRGASVNLIGQASGAEFFEWNMGDSSPLKSGTTRAIQYIYPKSGVYPVTLSVNRNGGSETNTISRKVYVADAESPFAIIDASNTSNSVIEEK